MPQEGVVFHATTEDAKSETVRPPFCAQTQISIHHLGYNKFQTTIKNNFSALLENSYFPLNVDWLLSERCLEVVF